MIVNLAGNTASVPRARLICRFEPLEVRTLLSGDPWQNPVNPLDVNGDGRVTNQDALMVVNAINEGITTFPTPAPSSASSASSTTNDVTNVFTPQNLGYLDVAGTGTLIPQDFLMVVNQLDLQASEPTLSVNNVQVAEPTSGNTATATFTVTLSAASTSTVTVGYATQNNTATSGADYVATSGTLTFTPGVTTQTFNVTVLSNPTFNSASENFFVNLTSPTNATVLTGQGIGTISEALPGLSIQGTSLTENGTGVPAQTANFVVTLSEAITSTVTVDYATASGTAAAGTDYTAESGILTFTPGGPTTQTIGVPILQNSNFTSGSKTFFVNLSTPSGASITSGQATATLFPPAGSSTGTLVDVSLKVTDLSGNVLTKLNPGENFLVEEDVQDVEPDPQGVYYAYSNITFSPALAQITGAVAFSSAYSSAESGNPDAAANSTGTLINVGAAATSITPLGGAVEEMFTIPMQASASAAGTLAFTVGPSSVAAQPPAGVFGDNNSVPASQIAYSGASAVLGQNGFSINNVTVPNVTSGTTTATFTVTRGASDGTSTIMVPYSTANGTAIAGTDYVAQSGTLTFGPTTTTQTIVVTILGNDTSEPNKSFTVNLGTPTPTGIDTVPKGTATIVSTAPEPIISISPVANSVSEGGSMTFTVSLAAAAGGTLPSGQVITVHYATSGGTAVPGADYTSASGTLTFAAGSSASQTFTVNTIYDTALTTSRTFQITLSGPTNATLGTAAATGTIVYAPLTEISGYVYVDTNDDGIKEAGEVGIQGVMVTLVNTTTGATTTTLTDANGLYSFMGLVAGTYNVIKTNPAFFVDGIATPGTPTPAGPDTEDEFAGITLASGTAATNFNFGEQGLRPQFASAFFDRRAFLATSIITGEFGPPVVLQNFNLQQGNVWISFDAGWQGLSTITGVYNTSLGSVNLQLYDYNLNLLASSNPNQSPASVSYSGTAGQPIFLEISGTNTDVNLQLSGAVGSLPTTSEFGSTSSAATASVATSVSNTAAATSSSTTAPTTVLTASSTSSGFQAASGSSASNSAATSPSPTAATAVNLQTTPNKKSTSVTDTVLGEPVNWLAEMHFA